MSQRVILVVIAGALVITGLVLGLRTISAGDNALAPVDCGSVLRPDSSAGKYSDAISGGDDGADCDKAISDAKPLAYGALGLGALALIGSLMVSSGRRQNA